MLSEASATYLQALAQRTVLGHRLRASWREGRLMTLTIAAFMALYMVAAYFLVSKGLEFVFRLPLLGPLLTERMLFLLFFFFFIMLVLSNAAITGISLFRRMETGWQLSLPMPHSSLVMWRTIEGLLLSSWGMLLLSAPILGGFAQTFNADAYFYVASLPAIICLIAIASNVSTWLLLLVVRFYRPWWLKAAGAILITLTVMIMVQIRDSQTTRLVSSDIATNVNQILRHTVICTHPLLPSSWVAETVIAAGKELPGRAWFYNLTLLSYALVVWLLTSWLSNKFFYKAWNQALSRAEQRRSGRREQLFGTRAGGLLSTFFSRILRLRRSTAALLGKDGRTFLREPMQWGQCALVFGLLLLYTSNLRHLGYNYKDAVWTSIISYLNLTVCSLAMSTLTTRFVFPQFSLEGQRLWILGLAPFPLTRVLRQKLLMNLAAATPLTGLLVIVSSISLRLPSHKMMFFLLAIIIITIGLNTMALSLGTLLPNFRETNSAKIVSGFGGTLCLVLSFFYIVICIAALIVPAVLEKSPKFKDRLDEIHLWEAVSMGAVFIVTAIMSFVPYIFAHKKTKRLANLGNP